MKKATTILMLICITLFTQAQIEIQSKVFLSGCYETSTSMMHDTLRQKNLIPIVSPYDNSTTTISSIFTTTGADAIVDWVLISIKSSSATYSQSCLVQRDGDIVDLNGSVNITFNVASDNYIVQVKHRNHLGCQTLNEVALSNTPTMVDFTSTSTQLYLKPSPNNNPSPLTGAEKVIGGVRCLYGGNCNQVGAYNNFVVYSNAVNSDRTALFNYTGLQGVILGYSIYDCNMNGEANFNGTLPDRLTILATCNNNANGLYVNQQTSF